jgi:RAB protein geranylgeranyltransferase component A
MIESYDVVILGFSLLFGLIHQLLVLGTGLKESLLAALLAKDGYRIFQIERDPYVGSETTPVSLKTFKFIVSRLFSRLYHY